MRRYASKLIIFFRELQVLRPFRILDHVPKATIVVPEASRLFPNTAERIRTYCACLEGGNEEMAMRDEWEFLHAWTAASRASLKTIQMKQTIRVAKRLEAKDRFYTWHCESESFTDSGEIGFDGDGSD